MRKPIFSVVFIIVLLAGIIISIFSQPSWADSDWRGNIIAMVTGQRNQASLAVKQAEDRVNIAESDLSAARSAMTAARNSNNAEAASIAREAEDVAKDEQERARELFQKAMAFLKEREKVLADVSKAVASSERNARGVVIPEKGNMQRFAADGSPITDFSQPLRPGERINIDAGGQAHLIVSRGDADVVLQEATAIKILQDDLAGFRAELNKGLAHIKAAVNKWANKRFEVYTPTAVTSVRGTEFIVRTSGRATMVQVLTGHVVVTPTSGKEPLTLEQGESATVTLEGIFKTGLSKDEPGALKGESNAPSH